ncbi:hypothetical protein NMY22_g6926 [Coprinellus aureogranulatus]|nr:hypothetical protein NMY22_g6926 [Coprinellus aureogranulatus]
MGSDEEELAILGENLGRVPKELVLEVIRRFTVRELLILSEVESFAELAHAELKHRLRALWKKFLLPAAETEAMMDREETILSGSGALYMVAPGSWSPSDIDFYCPEGKLGNVVDFLEKQGYVVVPGSWTKRRELNTDEGEGHDIGSDEGAVDGEETAATDIANEEEDVGDTGDREGDGDGETPPPSTENLYSKHVMKEVVEMQKEEEGSPLRTLNVIESALPCAEAPLFGFHSTVVMNAVTATGVVSFYPEWTVESKGVVNRASGIVAWKTKEQKKEQSALEKYRIERGYTIEDDCKAFHAKGQEECKACQRRMRSSDEGTSMAFERGGTFSISGRPFCWKLGQQPREAKKMFWTDRGVTILVQGNGDGRAYYYDGLAKETLCLTKEALLGLE